MAGRATTDAPSPYGLLWPRNPLLPSILIPVNQVGEIPGLLHRDLPLCFF